MVKRIAGYIRTIPDADPELDVEVFIKDDNTGANIPVGGMAGGSANPIHTNAVTGYFEWTCELSPGPVRVEAETLSGQKKVRSGREVMQNGEVFMSDQQEMLRAFSNGVMADSSAEFTTNASGLNLTVQPGMGVIDGRLIETKTNRVLAQPPNASLAVRNDLVVLQQWIGGSSAGKQAIALKQGTINGVDPTINTDPNVKEVTIYRAALANGGSTPTMSDLRPYASIYLSFNTIIDDFLSADGVLSTADLAKVLKAPTSGLTPTYSNLSLGELSDVASTGASDGQALKWVAGNSRWEPGAVATAHSSLTGIDTDTAPTAIHHTIGAGANQAAAGNHSHGAGLIESITDTASIDLVMTGSALSANAIFGTTGTTIAAGNHTHTGTYALTAHNHDASYSLTSHTHPAYSLTSHDHAGTYSALAHNHSGTYAPAVHTHAYAETSHNHAGEATKIDTAVKSYSTSSAVGDTSLAAGSVFLSSGITYDVFMIGMVQGHMGSGQVGNAQVGVRWESDATDWGMQVGTELGERPLMVIGVKGSVEGDGSNHGFTLRGRSTSSGTANFLAGTVAAWAIPRDTG